MDKQRYSNYPLTISQTFGLMLATDIAIPEHNGRLLLMRGARRGMLQWRRGVVCL